MRPLVLWFPDWPVQAVAAATTTPIIIAAQHHVYSCNQAARTAGVRRGMKVRAAQAVCPAAQVLSRDEAKEAAAFHGVLEALQEIAARVEILRPGLAVMDAAVLTRFYGDEAAVAERLIDASAQHGTDAMVGIADTVATAVLAARSGVHVVRNQRHFLDCQRVLALLEEPALGCEEETVRTLHRLGICTLGQLRALPRADVINRFGAAGRRCFLIASGQQEHTVLSPEQPITPWLVREDLDPPITRVDVAAFRARALAVRLHNLLRESGKTCHSVRITAEFEDGRDAVRTWRTVDALTESATADRVRWQLDGWLSHNPERTAGLVALQLEGIDCREPEPFQVLGGGDHARRERAHRAIARAQSAIGVHKILRPFDTGERGVATRVEFQPSGESPQQQADGVLMGALTGPLPPVLVHPATRVHLVDENAQPVTVTADALLSSSPWALKRGENYFLVTGWAGPWPVAGKWWRGEGPCARLQLVGSDEFDHPHAWLLVWAGTWHLEASYE